MRHVLLSCLLLVTFALRAPQAAAQDAEEGTPDKQEASTLRLRTYVNRLQIPTLVLAKDRIPVLNLPPSAFSISLDSGKPFHPTHARLEGDDPISLAVLIDTAGSQPAIVSHLAQALARLVPETLHATDTISIFSADCKMYRTRLNKTADADDIRIAVERALEAARPAAGIKRKSCSGSFRLLDFTAYMMMQMRNLPGRKVALLVTGGHESNSTTTIAFDIRVASRNAISVFGLRDIAESKDVESSLPLPAPSRYGKQEDPFKLLCASNGGVILDTGEKRLDEDLTQFFSILRTRYILEFPIPERGDSGLHSFEVSVKDKRKLLVRSSGASATLPDPALAGDPNVIPSSASPAVFGPRRPLDTTKR